MEAAALIEELAQGSKIVESLLAGITQEEAQIKPDLESRSILEAVCHLYDEEREDFRQRLDIMLHRPKEKWPPIRPEEWVTERHYNEQDLATVKKNFLAEREKSLEWLKGLKNPDWEAECDTPFGTTLKPGDMLSAWVEHDVLHLRQLVELRHEHVLRLAKPYQVRYAGEW
jgi:hypothetical protein